MSSIACAVRAALCTAGRGGTHAGGTHGSLGPSHRRFGHPDWQESSSRGDTPGRMPTRTSLPVSLWSPAAAREAGALSAAPIQASNFFGGGKKAEGRSSVQAGGLLCTRQHKAKPSRLSNVQAEHAAPRDGRLTSFHRSEMLPPPPSLRGGAASSNRCTGKAPAEPLPHAAYDSSQSHGCTGDLSWPNPRKISRRRSRKDNCQPAL